MAEVGRVVIMAGLPGVGKTRLALMLAAALAGQGHDVQVLHTDQLKLALRAAHPAAMAGPGWAGDRALKRTLVAPLLAAAARHARAAGSWLIVEGTLVDALPAGAVDWVVELRVAEAVRRARVAAKPEPARTALAHAELGPYAADLAAWLPAAALRLDGAGAPEALVAALLALTQPPPGEA